MIGEKIHSYEINQHLGRGGMGNVYKATDMMLGREVALKMLHPQLTVQEQFLDRFKKEARVLAQLLHPNIAVIYNFIEQGGNHFMVMEYVEGSSLDDLLKKYNTLPPEFVVPVFIQVLEGLQHAHKKNIFHRDIKPANIMLTPDGTVKLMDFGIAKIAGEQKMTQVNKIVGTVEFMAPELLQGKEASAASDIYATGVALYELLCGKLPFEADTDYNLMQAIMKQKIMQPVKFNASIPKALSDIVMKALDRNPTARFADASAFQYALSVAFPNYKTINTTALQTGAAGYAQGSPATRLEKITAGGMETREEQWNTQAPAVERLAKHFSDNKKIYLPAALLLLCLFIALAAMNSRSAEKQSGEITAQKPAVTENNNEAAGAGIPVNTTPVQEPVTDRRETKAETAKKPAEKVPEKPKEKNTEDAKPARLGFSAAEEEKEKPVAPKDVTVNSKLEISLYLQNDLGNAPERQDIPVTFSLNNAVVYNGVTIINKGALAKGVIKLGKIQTDVDINYINAANGQQISIKATKGHGRRNEITSNRNYTAFILPGTRIRF